MRHGKTALSRGFPPPGRSPNITKRKVCPPEIRIAAAVLIVLAAAAGLATGRAHACTVGAVRSDGGEAAWIARVLPLYLEHYCLAAPPPEEGPSPAVVTSSVSVSGLSVQQVLAKTESGTPNRLCTMSMM